MTLKPSQVLAALEAKHAAFATFNEDSSQLLERYRTALAETSRRSLTQLTALLQSHAHPGATPLEPCKPAPSWVLHSNLVWQNREQSLAWVRDRLTGVATFAVDGSQIYPSKDFSIPVALVQIGWFENSHLPTGQYEKEIALDVMTPEDLQADYVGEPVDRRVNMRRFEMETERLITFMEKRANTENCLAFLDGSLVVTFAEAFDDKTRNFYVRCVLDLLRASEQYRVPLVGYVDTSYARDLTTMLQLVNELPEARYAHDAQLLNPGMKWGDRTFLFRCQRSGILSNYQEQADRLAFTYLKTNDSYPARLEFPLWVYETGWLDRVVDWVRCEVIVGGGYPYVIETADQTAVLQVDDRQTFYRIFQDWAERESLNLRLSRKMVSKARRR
ncbi:MAG: DNA double-strand break repair nuclease NurA [Leptolyngbyaceae cyanobacterium bins.59]|nr:DNA double-strand break repair nuclease NurA [Leptolyngbyaceae cyanobacterium bins.59]